MTTIAMLDDGGGPGQGPQGDGAETVGLCLVSHSAQVAEGAAAMARQMTGARVRIAAAGGDPDGGLGTDVARIMAAIQAVIGPAGVAILYDLGGAETNAEMAVTLLTDLPGPVRLCPGPLVEGAVLAAVEASGGAPLEAVVAAVQDRAKPPGDEPDGPRQTGIEASTILRHPGGLHARPSVLLVQLAKRYPQARLEVGDGGRFVPAESLSQVLGLRLGQGRRITVRAVGPGARPAVDAVVALVEGLTEAASRRYERVDAPGGETARVAVPGIAIGPLWIDVQPVAMPGALGDVALERRRLDAGLAGARAELEALARDARGEAAAILSVQVTLIDDGALTGPVRQAVAGGEPAAVAWKAACDALIRAQRDAPDAYLRARVADLTDLRDRVLRVMAGGKPAEVPATQPPDGAIVLADDLTPSRFLAFDWRRLGGLALRAGSAASHVAVLARARDVPMAVGLGALRGVASGRQAVLDAALNGAPALILEPTPTQLAGFRARQVEVEARRLAEATRLAEPAATRDGGRITVMVNVDDPDALAGRPPDHCDGIGLARTEFLWHGAAMPSEDAQTDAYRRLLDWAAGRPVTIRTMDLGGDKPVPGLTPAGERNPFLGLRGIRLSLARPDVFGVQVRALARAAAGAPGLQVMLPMVTRPEEVAETRALFDAAVAALHGEGVAAALPRLGIMVEVPAVALTLDRFAVDFLSIGTNDLTQYVMAAARDAVGLEAVYDPLNPAVRRLVREVTSYGARTGLPVSVCGDMGADRDQLRALLEDGVTAISVPLGALAQAKATIAEWP